MVLGFTDASCLPPLYASRAQRANPGVSFAALSAPRSLPIDTNCSPRLRPSARTAGRACMLRVGSGMPSCKMTDGAGSQVLPDEPLDVPDRRVRGIVRIGRAQHADVSAFTSEPQLARPRETAGRPKQLRRCRDARGPLGLLQVA